MRKAFAIALALFVATSAGAQQSVVQQGQSAVLNWTGDYIEAIGQAVPPTGKEGTGQGKLLARRGAVVDLQRNLLEFIKGVQITSETTMENFMANDRVMTSLTGFIKNVAITDSDWDGEIYTLSGRIYLKDIRQATLPSIQQQIKKEKDEKKTPAPQPKPPTRSQNTGLVLDCRDLPLIPSITFRIVSTSGKEVYSFDQVDMEHFLASGLADYHSNMDWAKGQPRVAATPLMVKPVRVDSPKNVDIVVSDGDAAKIAALPDEIVKKCRVSIVKR